MTVEVELPDGRTLEFPDGVTPDVIQRTTKRMLAPPETGLEGHPEEAFQAGYAQSFPQPAPRPAAPPAPAPNPARGGIGDPGTLSGAVVEGWRAAPSFWTSPEARQTVANLPVSGPLLAPAGDIFSGILGAGNALWRGTQHVMAATGEAAGNAVPEIRVPGYGPISGTVIGGPGLGRDIAALPEAFPTWDFSGGTVGPQTARNQMMPPERPQFVSERTAPPRAPGTTDLERMQQLIQHDIVETNPAPSFVPPGTPRPDMPGVPTNDILRSDPTQAPQRPAEIPPTTTKDPVTGEVQPIQQPQPQTQPQPNLRAVPTPEELAQMPPAERILASAKSVAQQHYDIAQANGQDSAYTPQSVGKMVDAVDSAAPQGPGERAVGGENAVTRLQRDMEPLRGQSLTLADIQRMDERMSDHITEELRAGRNKVAGQLQDIQQKWREQADGVTADDVTGGQAGFQALDPARQAWSQYRKMSDVMLMKQRAGMTQNPTSSYQTAVKNFVTGKASRGWTDAEKAALQASADRGVIGGTLHLLGSRLLPHVGGAVGASVGGIPGFVAGEVVTHGMGAGARNLANTMQTGRVNRAMGVLGSSVPAPPINEMLRY